MLKRIGKKILWVIAFLLYLVLYCGFTVAVLEHSKVAYMLVLVCSVAVLIFLWNDSINILSVWAWIMIPYSVLVLCGLEAEVLLEKFGQHELLIAFLVVAEIMAFYSGKIVAVVIIPVFFFGLLIMSP